MSDNVFGPRRFSERHIGPSDADVRAMLEVVGCDSTDSLVDDAIPAAIRTRCALNLPAARTEEQR